jgi:uncharacterized protein (DUF302 family)
MQISTVDSIFSVAETVDKLTNSLQQNGIKVFVTIDHAKAARDAGMTLNDEVVLVFGDPKVGTLLMQESPTIGLELPLKLLVWQDANKKTHITYSDPTALAKVHGIKKHEEILKKMQGMLANLTHIASTTESPD